MGSLRVRLMLLLSAAIVSAALIQFATSFQAAMNQANKLFDYHMQQMAFALQDSSSRLPDWHILPKGDGKGFGLVIQIWTDDKARVYQSRDYRVLPTQGSPGYSTVTLDNGDWRMYLVKTEERTIQVAQKMDARRNRAISLVLNSLWPIIPVSLLLLATAWWVVSSALAPLNRIGRDLANRNANSLAPISDEGVPREVSRLTAELNSLLVRMERALQAQQRFVADAAHELRSPLAALKLQVQTLSRAKDDTARERGLQRLSGGVDRASRLVEQLLALARHDPSPEVADAGPVSLQSCLALAISDVGPMALAKGIGIDSGAPSTAEVMAETESLRIMIRNVLDNAVRYTPEQGEVRVRVRSDDTSVILTIADSGQGIDERHQARIFDRFYRVPGTGPNGSGLGLAIVKAIAERCKASVHLANGEAGGLAVTIRFPLYRKPAPPSSPSPP